MMRRSQHRAPEALNADLFELLDEADVLKQELEQAKGNVNRLKHPLLQAEQEQTEKECKLDENLSRQLDIRQQVKQLASQAKFESDLQQTPQPSSRKRIKPSSPDDTYSARPSALPASTQDRPGLVPNPEWSKATWKDHVILTKDQVEFKGYTYLNNELTSIVLVDNAWHELFCQICGANSSRDAKGDFFRMDSLKIHMTKAHGDDVGHYPSEIEDSDIAKDFHQLSAEEIKALRSGKMTIKTVRGREKPRVRTKASVSVQNDIENDIGDEDILRDAQEDEHFPEESDAGQLHQTTNDVSDEIVMAAMEEDEGNGKSATCLHRPSLTSDVELPGARIPKPPSSVVESSTRRNLQDPAAERMEYSGMEKKRKRISYGENGLLQHSRRGDEEEEDLFVYPPARRSSSLS
ncbi:hypothetical protein HII31_00210 [Pseudocercospora fuligena]|uniref:Uncharacterized protein n=1 Tax=Pseudocercospora fuligena TaxID=685502 RepID=A0A8H6RYE0_9PEZI|nr:hypothetical protein HII31_00210 [Pseudocercospora fuligena]